MLVALDFDGVLHDPERVAPGQRMGVPVDGALESVRALVAAGHTLIVHTARENRGDHVTKWLNYFGFPALPVTQVKPNADVFVDDRAVRFTDWPSTLAALEG